MSHGDKFLALHDGEPKHRPSAKITKRRLREQPRITLIKELATEQQLRTLAALCKSTTGQWPSAAMKARWRRMSKAAAKGMVEAYRARQAR
jgi:hypothetical protein